MVTLFVTLGDRVLYSGSQEKDGRIIIRPYVEKELGPEIVELQSGQWSGTGFEYQFLLPDRQWAELVTIDEPVLHKNPHVQVKIGDTIHPLGQLVQKADHSIRLMDGGTIQAFVGAYADYREADLMLMLAFVAAYRYAELHFAEETSEEA